jgi:hypothetical protein
MQPGKREVNARSQTVVNFEMTRGLIRPVPEAGISIPPDADGSLGISGVVPFGDPSSSYLSLSVANKFRSIQASPETARRSGTRASCHDGAQDPQEASLESQFPSSQVGNISLLPGSPNPENNEVLAGFRPLTACFEPRAWCCAHLPPVFRHSLVKNIFHACVRCGRVKAPDVLERDPIECSSYLSCLAGCLAPVSRADTC